MTEATADDPLEDFVPRRETLLEATRTVYVAGRGPAVIVMAEMPGISPDVARFARWVRDAGFTVYMPSLFGTDGRYPHADEGLGVLRRACVAAEFRALASGASSPITDWLRALAQHAHAERGGPGVGVIGMCFTGSFAISLMLDPSVRAAVACQPSLPMGELGAIQLAKDEADAIRARIARGETSVLAYRFAGDRFCTAQRFAAYEAALGEGFVGRVLPDEAASTTPPPFFRDVVGCPHSVVTAHLVDAEGSPTRRARDEILAFFVARLGGGS